MRNAGLGSWPERRLRMTPDRDAIWFEGVTMSHGELALRVRRAASALAALGVRGGDRVAWFSANHPSALETLYACGQLGAIWVPLNSRLTVPEVEYILGHSGASVVLHGREQAGHVRELTDRLPAVTSWIAIEPPAGGEGCGLGHAHELHGEVSIGRLTVLVAVAMSRRVVPGRRRISRCKAHRLPTILAQPPRRRPRLPRSRAGNPRR